MLIHLNFITLRSDRFLGIICRYRDSSQGGLAQEPYHYTLYFQIELTSLWNVGYANLTPCFWSSIFLKGMCSAWYSTASSVLIPVLLSFPIYSTSSQFPCLKSHLLSWKCNVAFAIYIAMLGGVLENKYKMTTPIHTLSGFHTYASLCKSGENSEFRWETLLIEDVAPIFWSLEGTWRTYLYNSREFQKQNYESRHSPREKGEYFYTYSSIIFFTQQWFLSFQEHKPGSWLNWHLFYLPRAYSLNRNRAHQRLSYTRSGWDQH